MTKRHSLLSFKTLCHMIVMVGMLGAFTLNSIAQTAANTDIKNVASATYSDGTNSYDAVSNEVTVTVAKVAGLTITPDGQDDPTVVPGQTLVTKTFTVTNIGNFTDQVKFLANGGSVTLTGPGTITAITAGGTDIFTNSADVLKSLAQNGTVTVVVTYTVNSSASAGDVIQVFLGDTTTGTNFDNEATDTTTHNVSTVSTGAVNGSREARGDISAEVAKDALPQITMTVPSGPVALGSTITYSNIEACNVGERDLLPISPDTQVYVYSAIPAGTELTNLSALVTAYPGVQFTTTALTTAPLSATWANLTGSTTASTITRIRIPVGTSIAAGDCATPVSFDVKVTTDNANTPISEIAEVYGSNSVGSTVFDQTGDTTPGSTGTPQTTTLEKTGGVFNGPSGSPQASGPTSTNDDFTNRSVNTGINVAPGGVTTAGGTTTFTNTLENTGNADDTYTLTAPTVPSGFTVQICTGGTAAAPTGCVDVSSGGSTTLAVPFGSTANYFVQVTAPTGSNVLNGFDTVIRATSGTDNTKTNDTINRLYTGFIKLEKTAVITNGTGVGGATDPVPGAVITYTIKYTNISEAGTSSGSVGLTATNLVITEDGDVAPNNWLTYTNRVAASEFDYVGATGTTAGTGTINAYVADASQVTDTIASVAPQYIGRLVFKRTIKLNNP